MVRQYIRHRVEDYDAWRRIYDGYEERRRTGRVLGSGIYRGIDDPNDVTVWHDYEDEETAKAYASAPVVDDAWAAGGVLGEPQVWFVREC